MNSQHSFATLAQIILVVSNLHSYPVTTEAEQTNSPQHLVLEKIKRIRLRCTSLFWALVQFAKSHSQARLDLEHALFNCHNATNPGGIMDLCVSVLQRGYEALGITRARRKCDTARRGSRQDATPRKDVAQRSLATLDAAMLRAALVLQYVVDVLGPHCIDRGDIWTESSIAALYGADLRFLLLNRGAKESGTEAFARGGFEAKMSRREAALILGIKENAPKDKLKQAHRTIMLLNHPDRGGSPYLATKINEAKELLERMR
nr:mitochondrial import inner membrane translocase subunit TIM14 [Polyrhizophydium stewartii]